MIAGFRCGVVFEYHSDGQLETWWAFTGGAEGAIPDGGLVMDGVGNHRSECSWERAECEVSVGGGKTAG
jgi:hypothetical protein